MCCGLPVRQMQHQQQKYHQQHMRSLLEVAECVRRTPPCMHTLEHALHVCLAAALDNAPAGALYKIQEVVVEPESHQHLHWECQHLVVFFWGGGGAVVLCMCGSVCLPGCPLYMPAAKGVLPGGRTQTSAGERVGSAGVHANTATLAGRHRTHRCVGHAPDGCTHWQHIVVTERSAVAVTLQVLP